MNDKTNSEPDKSDTLLEFPCHFQLKVMGYNRDDFAHQMHVLTQKHVAQQIQEKHIIIKPSRTGKFLSVNISFTAESKHQLDTIYQSLTAHELVTMAL